jgi:hypothetical protein
MNRVLAIGSLAGLLVCAAACTDTAAPAKPAHTSGGVVTGKVAHRLISPGPGCRSAVVTLPACTSWWRLEIRTKAGSHYTFDVSKSTYSRCHLNDRYPACVSGGRR